MIYWPSLNSVFSEIRFRTWVLVDQIGQPIRGLFFVRKLLELMSWHLPQIKLTLVVLLFIEKCKKYLIYKFFENSFCFFPTFIRSRFALQNSLFQISDITYWKRSSTNWRFPYYWGWEMEKISFIMGIIWWLYRKFTMERNVSTIKVFKS